MTQTAAVRQWAQQAGVLFGPAINEPILKGGREHFLVKTQKLLHRVVKITIGPEFGYYPCRFPNQQWRDVCNWFSTRKALPLEYCERLLLLNELYPRCETHLLGLVDRGDTLHAVTAQLIARGRPAEVTPIWQWMQAEGFSMVMAWTWFRRRDGVALFDVMSQNVMACDDGEMVPFDVIPIRCEGGFLEMMHAAEERLRGESRAVTPH